MVTATLPDSRPKTKPHSPSAVKKRKEAASSTAAFGLLLFFTRFFPAALACQSFFYTLLLAGLQIKRVALNLLNDVFLLHLAFEAAQRIFQRFALLQPDFRQSNYTPQTDPGWDLLVIAKVHLTSQAHSGECGSPLSV